ncbi:hypothetical protein KOW79_014705 [Hemibagrus wyckioides]|uniref:Connexin N-terminal domain-containing protein n=1 Tax=Hemibagrus wyckioides TaxID=337641 RepID=A0A9D3SF21_9TELE|nr:hypothetical protein KOW79_014705 [Hemibagrus wyckioides]
MGDWSILGRFLVEVQNHSTVIGKIWLTVLLIFRILLVTLIGDAVYSDEQSKFICNTLQPGCNNVCYDTFAPVSHLRFWVFQIVLVSTPSIFYIIYALHKITDDENVRTEEAQALPHHPHHPKVEYVRQSGGESDVYLGGKPSNGVQDEESPSEEEGVEQSLLQDDYRELGKDPTEYSGQILLIYIVHVVFRSILEIMFLVGQYYMFGFKLRLRHSLRGRLVLQSSSATLSHEKTATAMLSHGPSIAFETDSTLECTSKTNLEEKTCTGIKLSNITKLNSKKSWL